MKRVFAFILLLSCTACYPVYLLAPNTSGFIVRIESDTEWEGTVGTQWVSGAGTQAVPVNVPYGRDVCWDIHKTKYDAGLLRVFLTYRDYYAGSSTHPRYGDMVTLTARGRIRNCARP